MGKTTNKFSPEVRARAVRLVLDHDGEHASRWAAVASIAADNGSQSSLLIPRQQPLPSRLAKGSRNAPFAWLFRWHSSVR
jgi:transposase-like protein